MPFQRRVPKRGFNNSIFKKKYVIINVKDLEKLKGLKEVNLANLLKMGVKKKNYALKVLGNGELSKKLNVTAQKFSKTAEEKIKAALRKGKCGFKYVKDYF